MNLLDKITLVIPTHYRHNYLKRLLSYYEGGGIKILVADSTDVEFKDKDKFDIDYYHYPDYIYSKKLYNIVNKVVTPYMVFCADDDFIILSSIEKSIQFLEKHNDYAFCQGYTYTYQKFNNKVVFWLTRYQHNNEHNQYLDRIKSQVSTPYYGVNRTNNVKQECNKSESWDFKNPPVPNHSLLT